MKNLTPRQIALYAAAILTAAVLIVTFTLQLLVNRIDPTVLAILTISIFPISYFLISYMLEIFIYRKVKVLYKSIFNRKSSSSMPSRISPDENILDEVEQEVIAWAEDHDREIEQYKKNEQYRRDFIGNISHELKTPIFNVQGYLHTLIDGGLNDPKINLDYLYKAAKNLDRLNNIVEDLEIISSLESGKLNLDILPFDIYELAKEVFELLEIQADSYEINLDFKKGSKKSTIVLGDRDRIRQVLINLISNSIKYGKDLGNTLIGFYDMDENILIEISDNGIGISDNHLPRLFERFYRVDTSRSRNQGGTGLGLAIVKHIIEAHKQTINVRSTVEIGSTFGFTLKKG